MELGPGKRLLVSNCWLQLRSAVAKAGMCHLGNVYVAQKLPSNYCLYELHCSFMIDWKIAIAIQKMREILMMAKKIEVLCAPVLMLDVEALFLSGSFADASIHQAEQHCAGRGPVLACI